MKCILISLLIICLSLFAKRCNSQINSDLPISFDYLQEKVPGDTPIVFGLGTVSVADKNTHACMFSPDGKYMFFTKLNFNPQCGYVYWVSTDFISKLKINSMSN